MNESIATPIRVTSNGYVKTGLCNVSAITVTPLANDVVVKFYDGMGGTCIWEIEADNAAGSHSVSFPSPFSITNGLYVVADIPANLESVCVAFV